jgi:hypothetical protein
MLSIIGPVLIVLALLLQGVLAWSLPLGAVLGLVGIWLCGFFSSYPRRDPRNLYGTNKA